METADQYILNGVSIPIYELLGDPVVPVVPLAQGLGVPSEVVEAWETEHRALWGYDFPEGTVYDLDDLSEFLEPYGLTEDIIADLYSAAGLMMP